MSKDIRRITTIIEKITHIQNIVLKFDGKVSKALEDMDCLSYYSCAMIFQILM